MSDATVIAELKAANAGLRMQLADARDETADARACASWAVSGLYHVDKAEAQRRWTWLLVEEEQ